MMKGSRKTIVLASRHKLVGSQSSGQTHAKLNTSELSECKKREENYKCVVKMIRRACEKLWSSRRDNNRGF